MNKGFKFAKTGLTLLLVTILSKVAAFLVTIVFSYYFGTDIVTDAYYAAGSIPNLVNNSLVVCVLTLFIPVYTKCLTENGKDAANEFSSIVLNSFVIFNIVLFLVVCAFSPILAKLVAPGFDQVGLAHTRNMICLLSMSFPITVAANTFTNLYNANQKYILPALVTLLNHLLVIVGTIVISSRMGEYSYPFVCTGVWVVQLVILAVCANRKIYSYRFIINTKNKYFRYILVQSIPVMIATAADQINLAADNIISSDLPTGSLSCIGYAHRIFNSINGLVTATLLTMYYPIISKQYAERNTEGLDNSIRKYFDMMLLLTLPLMGLLIINSDGIMDVLFNRGAMESSSISRISILFIVYSSGLMFIAMKDFVTRLFYIIGNTRTPTIINIICVAMNVCLSLILKRSIEIYGIALATTIATGVCALFECIVLIRKAGGKKAMKKHNVVNWKNIVEIFIACVVAAFLSFMLKSLAPIEHSVVSVFISGISYCVIFVISMIVMKNEYVVRFKEYAVSRK